MQLFYFKYSTVQNFALLSELRKVLILHCQWWEKKQQPLGFRSTGRNQDCPVLLLSLMFNSPAGERNVKVVNSSWDYGSMTDFIGGSRGKDPVCDRTGMELYKAAGNKNLEIIHQTEYHVTTLPDRRTVVPVLIMGVKHSPQWSTVYSSQCIWCIGSLEDSSNTIRPTWPMLAEVRNTSSCQPLPIW